MSRFIWVYHITVIRLIQHKFSLLGLIGFDISFKMGLLYLYIGFVFDLLTSLVIATHSHIKIANGLHHTLKVYNYKFKSYSHPILENIISYFSDYNLTVNFRNKISNRGLFIAKVEKQIGSLYSFPFMYGRSVILLPETFDETELRDRILFAHEYSHCISHDLMITLENSIIALSIMILCLGVISMFFTSVGWVLYVSIFVSVLSIISTKLSFQTKIETEANADSIAYAKYAGSPNYYKVQETILLLFKNRLNSLIATRCKLYTMKFFSELNQLYELITIFDDTFRPKITQCIKEKYNVSHPVMTKAYRCKLKVISWYLQSPGINIIGRQRLAIEKPLLILFPLIFVLYINWGLIIIPEVSKLVQLNYIYVLIVMTILLVLAIFPIKIVNKNIWKKREKILDIGI